MCKVKVLYVAAGFKGSTTIDRKNALIGAEWDIHHLSTDPWMREPGRFWRCVHHRFHTGPLIWKLNNEIYRKTRELKPDVVWVDKGIWVSPKTIAAIKFFGAKVVHYTPDPAIVFHATPNFLKSIPLYDLMFTTKRWEIDAYKQFGASRVYYSMQSTSSSRTRPVLLSQNEVSLYDTDVVFLGHAEDHYIQTMLNIIERIPTVRLKIWGAWQKAVCDHPILMPYWQKRGAYDEDYAKALSGAKIGLGFLSKLIPETETTRTFEIPACGTFLLAERTDSHSSLFEEGKEAEFFSSPEEAAAKITYYLENDEDRRRVAESGYRRFIGSKYSAEHVMQRCALEVEKLL